ncbi:MAG: glycosyltransferase [Phycisphaerae bacterium]|jgi:glycosyltransferase involved in cell wall biosynthesis
MASAGAEPSVALAHHWLVNMRGGERVLAAMAAMFPDAPIYTLMARPAALDADLRARDIRVSWLQRLAWLPGGQRLALPVLVSAARSLDASGHEVVICSDAAAIKAIRTRPEALKLCYCHSPMRYVWDLYDEYRGGSGLAGRAGLRLFAGRLRRGDQEAAETVTAFIANSRYVAGRIRRCYGREASVIHPPVNTDFPPPLDTPEDFYLVVGEQVRYKRNDLAVRACNRLRRRLVIIGGGPLLGPIRRAAGPTVTVLGRQSDATVRDHLRRCRALLFCGREDFGIVPVEAQAAGRPVIAFAEGGVLETVIDGRTGVFFHEQTVESLAAAIERFEAATTLLSPARIQAHAARFSAGRFREEFTAFYHWCLELYRAGGPHRVRSALQTDTSGE